MMVESNVRSKGRWSLMRQVIRTQRVVEIERKIICRSREKRDRNSVCVRDVE